MSNYECHGPFRNLRLPDGRTITPAGRITFPTEGALEWTGLTEPQREQWRAVMEHAGIEAPW